MVRLFAAAVMSLDVLMGGCSGEPTNYDDCILKHVRAGMDQSAVLAVTRSCRTKFPPSETIIETDDQRERDLTAIELKALTGRASRYGSEYSGTIYNGNADIAIKEVEITVRTTMRKEKDARSYRTEISIPPLSATTFSFRFIPGDEGATYGWSIVGARGTPAGPPE